MKKVKKMKLDMWGRQTTRRKDYEITEMTKE
jgi:hypothetical protein